MVTPGLSGCDLQARLKPELPHTRHFDSRHQQAFRTRFLYHDVVEYGAFDSFHKHSIRFTSGWPP